MAVPSNSGGLNGLTPGSRVMTVRDKHGITGYDLTEGEQRWRWELPEVCETPYWKQDILGRTTVLVPMDCRGATRGVLGWTR
jgi:hypothetical protein